MYTLTCSLFPATAGSPDRTSAKTLQVRTVYLLCLLLTMFTVLCVAHLSDPFQVVYYCTSDTHLIHSVPGILFTSLRTHLKYCS